METKAYRRKTKIVCTIGPGSSSHKMVERLLDAGMDLARLNLSHGSHEEHAKTMQTLRETAKARQKNLAILLDLPGPKIRTGDVKDDGVSLKEGEAFALKTEDMVGDERRVSVSLKTLPDDVKPGVMVLLSDGTIRLLVERVQKREIFCRVVSGGVLRSRQGINVPGVRLSVEALTEDDEKHLAFGLREGVDFVAMSFVRDQSDILKLKRLIGEQGKGVPVVAKIEKHEAAEAIFGILEATDAVMVARGDLGLETPLERVPVLQKAIIQAANRLGKPVIVATQMLESMVQSPMPTRAEVSDVANAIFDGADAVMLSEETAIGRYPDLAAAMMAKIAHEVERALPYESLLAAREHFQLPQVDDAIAHQACHAALQLGAKVIVAYTSTGSTARRLAKYRPKAPILAITPSMQTARELCLNWGVIPFFVPDLGQVEEVFTMAEAVSKQTGLANPGDLIVITAGLPWKVPGNTNLIKVQQLV
jgi:pyruvate kinase